MLRDDVIWDFYRTVNSSCVEIYQNDAKMSYSVNISETSKLFEWPKYLSLITDVSIYSL